MRIRALSRLSGVVFFALVLAACNGSSGSNGGITPPGVPQGASRIYVACSSSCGATGQVLQFLTPLSNSTFELAVNVPVAFSSPQGATVDPSGSRLFLGAQGGVIAYNLPLTSANQPPFFTISIPGSVNVQLAFDSAGRLYVPTGNLGNVEVFNPPITGASAPAVTHTGYSDPVSVTFDASGNIYVTDIIASKVFVYAPPFTSSSAPVVTLGTANGISLATTATVDPFNRLAVVDRGGGYGIRFFTLPVTAASTPVFSVVSGVNFPTAAAFDFLGNMYVTNDGATKSITSYAAPLTGASTPTATVTSASGGFTNANFLGGLSFGP